MPSIAEDNKSSLITAVSDAKPKIADYPFTTLHPNLGVVRVGPLQSFVMADLPGLIEGAAQGQGLGIQFLKHLSRCRLLLHMIDLAQSSTDDDACTQYKTIDQELQQYGDAVTNKDRWLVFNKIDLLSQDESDRLIQQCIKDIGWQSAYYAVSAASRIGLDELCNDIILYLQNDEEHS